uniref:uncharacterized protein LOC122772362 isoform X1 n=1 Tax=Solea senegalensis TaxID=28829 RepID=UPI001CD89ED2|nr:uncharacterized protein LOC122772362 isoform X1 [Solea senegalensis]
MVKQQQTRSWIDTWTWRCTPQIWTEAWVLTSWPHSSESISAALLSLCLWTPIGMTCTPLSSIHRRCASKEVDSNFRSVPSLLTIASGRTSISTSVWGTVRLSSLCVLYFECLLSLVFSLLCSRNHPFRNECNNRWKRCRHDDSHRHHHSSASASLSPVFTCGLIFILMYLEFHWMLMTMTLVRQQFQVSPCRLSIRAPLSPHTWTTE